MAAVNGWTAGVGEDSVGERRVQVPIREAGSDECCVLTEEVGDPAREVREW